MSRSSIAALVSIQVLIDAAWYLGIHVENGVDGLLYHHMAQTIATYAYAPWIVSPLSYIGIYPGSDSSGVPFLVASIVALSGLPLNAAILVYNLSLVVGLAASVFVMVHSIVRREDAALLALLLCGLSYGFFSSMEWTLDERSFNVAFAPILVYLIVSVARVPNRPSTRPALIVLGLVAFVMYASHLSLLLLLPLAVLVPLLRAVALRQHTFRRKRLGSSTMFVAAVLLPVLSIFVLSLSGVLSGLGLQISLEHSAVMTGSSALAYLVNSAVFLTTRAGPTLILLAALGLTYMASRSMLHEESVVIWAILIGGLVGLPVIVYSKDVVIPLIVIPAAVTVPVLVRKWDTKRVPALFVAAVLMTAGSLLFDQWNMNRTTAYSNGLYWTSSGLTMEPSSANLWLASQTASPVCLYGNNWLATRYASANPYEFLCGDSPVEDLVWMQLGPDRGQAIHFEFIGIRDPAPSDWFSSPELDQIASNFASIPAMDYATGMGLLLRYHVSYIVVALARPMAVPLYEYEGARQSRFFTDLWTMGYPLYRSSDFAVFAT